MVFQTTVLKFSSSSSLFYHYKVFKPFSLPCFTLLPSNQTYNRHSFSQSLPFLYSFALKPILIFPTRKQNERNSNHFLKSQLFRFIALGSQNIAAIANGTVEGITPQLTKPDGKIIFECR
uniref:Uncharacterized protein n=1 Tax=Sphaerodactylus townsendi TaxID=933632 RepID=A0ACB8E897_9SAUR